MKRIGKYQNRQIFWFDYGQFKLEELPKTDWLCLATSDINPNDEKFERFVRYSIDNGILEFKGHGEYGEKLHDIFDETMVDIEITNGIETIDIATTWHNDETFADAFWQCFFATTLPTRTNYEIISIICTDLKGVNRTKEIVEILKRFENGWIPD
ncbi:MAG: hypothetical protein KDD24_02765 [Flavobacteriales bacterium]|nr:hypothetical protein [Flavobacteriales bacterium]MCB9173515.1 hypothetical protein [Flavobacteriales bacterium]